MHPPIHFARINWILSICALVTLTTGYLLLRLPPADGTLSLTVAPLLLVLGYCILVPAAILARDRSA